MVAAPEHPPMTRAFWRSALMVFVAMRLGDAINAVTGLWVIPSRLPHAALGAVLPLMQFGAMLALPVGVLGILFGRYLCAYTVAAEFRRAQGFLRDTLLLSAGGLGVGLLVAAGLMPWLCHWLHLPRTAAIYWAVGTAFLSTFFPMLTTALQATKRFGALSLSALLSAPVRLLGMWLLLPLLGLSGYFIGQLTALGAGATVALLAIWRLGRAWGLRERLPFALWRGEARQMLRYGAWVALGQALAAIQGTALTFTLRHKLGTDISAAYYLLSRFAELATYCATTLALVLVPYAIEAKRRQIATRTWELGMQGGLLLCGLLLAGTLALGLPHLFRWLPDYAPYAAYTPHAALLALIATLNGCASLHFATAMARDNFRWLAYALPITLSLSVALLALPLTTLPQFLACLLGAALLQAACIALTFLRRHETPPRDRA